MSNAADAPPAPATGSRLRRGRFRRGASILPSLFTTGNIFLGFWSMIKTMHGDYAEAAPMIGWAIVLDMLDGRIARMTGTTSDFGGELDSLADVISFGVAPALLAFSWAFSTVPRAGWLAAFLFLTCGTLRLARFNVQKSVVDGRFFVGLPIPAAAAQVAAWVYFMPQPIVDRRGAIFAMGMLVLFAFLMVSTFRYWSGKKVDLGSRRSYINVVGIAVSILLVALHPEWVLLALATLYWMSAPAFYLAGLLLRKRRDAPAAPGTP
jgi:CDP-diacylglycerol---serine O-phosphatidyltransferase